MKEREVTREETAKIIQEQMNKYWQRYQYWRVMSQRFHRGEKINIVLDQPKTETK